MVNPSDQPVPFNEEDRNLLRQIASSLNVLTNEIKEIKVLVQSIDGRLHNLENGRGTVDRRDNLTLTVSNLTIEVNAMKGDIVVMKNDIAVMKNDIVVIKNDIRDLKLSFTRLERRVERIHFDSAEYMYRTEQLEDRVTKLEDPANNS